MPNAKSARAAGRRRQKGIVDSTPAGPVTGLEKPELSTPDRAAIATYLRWKRQQAQQAIDTLQVDCPGVTPGGNREALTYWRHVMSAIRWLDAGLVRTGGRHRAD